MKWNRNELKTMANICVNTAVNKQKKQWLLKYLLLVAVQIAEIAIDCWVIDGDFNVNLHVPSWEFHLKYTGNSKIFKRKVFFFFNERIGFNSFLLNKLGLNQSKSNQFDTI